MPIYEYQCSTCKRRFEALVLPSHPAACPGCGGVELKRMVSMFAVSSEQIRQSNIKSERKRTAGIRKEKQDAQAKYEEAYRKDHGG